MKFFNNISFFSRSKMSQGVPPLPAPQPPVRIDPPAVVPRSRAGIGYKGRGVRTYNAGMVDRLTSDFSGSNLSFNSQLRVAFKTMRGRSRNLARNEPYTKAFLDSCVRNVVGHDGLRFSNIATNPDGTLDEAANKKIKVNFAKWGHKKTCTVTKRVSWAKAQRMICRMVARDGEVFVRKVRGFKNDFGFAIQIIPADYVDDSYDSERLPNGNRVIMGVEINAWGEPVAYHVLKHHPSDFSARATINGETRERIEAKEICHWFIQEDSEQVRGVPWIYVAITRLNQLGAYEEAEVIAARLQACKMGFLETKDDEPYTGDDEDEEGNTINEASPGMIEKLPPNMTFKSWDPTHPNANMGIFEKAMLRGICAGIGDNYNTLAQDLEGVNFSSIRAGTIDVREAWKVIQQAMIEDVADDVFEDWLSVALLTDFLKPLPYSKFDKFNQPFFRGRRWPWVDPEKDLKAQALAVAMGWKTNSQVIEDTDGDPDEIWATLAEEQKKMKALGIKQSDSLGKDKPAGEDGENLEAVKAQMDAYGVGIRAGALTANEGDEVFWRKKLGLPVEPEPVKTSWKEAEVRLPITLQSQETFDEGKTGNAPKPPSEGDPKEE